MCLFSLSFFSFFILFIFFILLSRCYSFFFSFVFFAFFALLSHNPFPFFFFFFFSFYIFPFLIPFLFFFASFLLLYNFSSTFFGYRTYYRTIVIFVFSLFLFSFSCVPSYFSVLHSSLPSASFLSPLSFPPFFMSPSPAPYFPLQPLLSPSLFLPIPFFSLSPLSLSPSCSYFYSFSPPLPPFSSLVLFICRTTMLLKQ